MSRENYVEGDLGVVFNQAEPLTLPIVLQLLRGRRDTGDDADIDSDAAALIERAQEHLELMQDICADESCVQRVVKMKLRLRDDSESAVTNAHLSNLVLDGDGTVIGVRSGGRNDAGGEEVLKVAQLRPFEVVALATLRPKTLDEAVVLVPSLSCYEPSDLNVVLETLNFR